MISFPQTLSCPPSRGAAASHRAAFTLVELLIVISIMTILAGLSVVVIRGANQKAKESRSEAQLDQIRVYLQYRWDEYEVRILPFRVASTNREQLIALRNDALMELIRAEMPYEKQHVKSAVSPSGYFPSPAFGGLSPIHTAAANDMNARWPSAYRRYVATSQPEANWSDTNEQAECLYLILQSIIVLDKSGIDQLHNDEVGDTDGDGMLEVLDAFGEPLQFLIEEDFNRDGNWNPVDFNNLPYGAMDLERVRFIVRSSRLDDSPTVREDSL